MAGIYDIVSVLAWPAHPRLREQLRSMGVDVPKYLGDSEHACADCGLRVLVGPRSLEHMAKHPGVKARCPWCVARLTADASEVTSQNLGNKPITE